MGYAVKRTPDGGYILAGEHAPATTTAEDRDFFLAKTDANGEIVFEASFGTSTDIEAAYAVQNTVDGGFVLIGHVGAPEVAGTTLVVKTDKDGVEDWVKEYDILSSDMHPDMDQTSDGGFIMVGNTGLGSGSCTLVKTDGDGEIVWTKSYDGVSLNGAIHMSVRETDDMGYFVVTYRLLLSGSMQFYMMKVSEAGDLEWSKDFSEEAVPVGVDGLQTSDGGYVGVGYFFEQGKGDRTLLIKTDSAGEETWRAKLGFGGGHSNFATSVEETPEGGFVMAGITTDFGAPVKAAMLTKASPSGEFLWSKAYNRDGKKVYAYDVEVTDDGGYIMVGGAWR